MHETHTKPTEVFTMPTTPCNARNNRQYYGEVAQPYVPVEQAQIKSIMHTNNIRPKPCRATKKAVIVVIVVAVAVVIRNLNLRVLGAYFWAGVRCTLESE